MFCSCAERCPSGLRSTLGKRVYGEPYRGFESLSLRQLLSEWIFENMAVYISFKTLEKYVLCPIIIHNHQKISSFHPGGLCVLFVDIGDKILL